jgi:8-oxo-dGTP pyrophosphatase MutT (NUDIX family)
MNAPAGGGPPKPPLTRRPLKCDGLAPTWVSTALESAKHVKVLTLAIPVVTTGSDGDGDAQNDASSPASAPSVRLLLGRKKRGFGQGYFNGFGGKLEPGESTADAALRELREESGLSGSDLEHRGVLTFVFDDQTERPWQVHVFSVRRWGGEPEETDEMAPRWFGASELPFAKMWSDDRFWYPRFCEAVAVAGGGGDEEEDEGKRATAARQPPDQIARDGEATARVSSAPCFEGVFGFCSTHEMAWAGLWALEEREGGERSAVADEVAASERDEEQQEDKEAARDAAANLAACAAWLPPAPGGGANLEPESLAHLARAAELARLTAKTRPTAWGGWKGGEA